MKLLPKPVGIAPPGFSFRATALPPFSAAFSGKIRSFYFPTSTVLSSLKQLSNDTLLPYHPPCPLISGFERFLVRSDDLDPDIHFNIDGRCSYFVEDKFNDVLQNETAISREQLNHLSFFHLNIRSLQNKVDELSTLLSTLNIKFSVVGITETWLQDPPLGVNIDGYNFVYKNRRVRSGGGVGLYLSDNLDYRIRTDIYADEDEVMESLFIEIIRPHERNVIVGLIYRPPSQNVNDFVTRMNDVLEKLSRDNKTCYLMGDFNLNLLNNENHNATVTPLGNS